MFPLNRYDETQSALWMSGGKFEIDIHGMCAMQANAATNRKKKKTTYLQKQLQMHETVQYSNLGKG